MSLKKVIVVLVALMLAGVAAVATTLIVLSSNLPQLITVKDYEPLLVSEVFDRNNRKIGEFYRERRKLLSYDEIPKILTHAFVAAEDSSFFKHGGINVIAMARAALANLRAGRRAQGASTITQQVARSLLLQSREKTYTRKIREIILALKMEANLSKEEILYLYLNQIYLGQGAYGVAMASEIYFRKPVSELTLAEAALLAGLPQAPSRYSPIHNPSSAKARQAYVLQRMAEESYITKEEAEKAVQEPLHVYVREDYAEMAPFYLETLRQLLVQQLGEETVLDKGIRIYTGLDIDKQLEAQKQVRLGLRELDKRQGYRGPSKNMEDPKEIAEFLLKTRNQLIESFSPVRVIKPDGTVNDYGPLNLTGKNEKGEPLPLLPEYIKLDQIVDGIVTNVDDEYGLVTVRFAESKGLIDLDTMKWARKPDPSQRTEQNEISKPSEALKKGDVISVKVVSKKFQSERIDKMLSDLKKKQKKKYERPKELPNFSEYVALELEQEPEAEASLLSLDQNTSEIIAMVGGYDYARSQFNRAIQAARQTGSAFKAIVYSAALDKGFHPATPIIDAPIVFEEIQSNPESESDDPVTKTWKPTNHSQKFIGDILFRNALIKSLNVPTVKIIEKIGVDWVADYARRLGVFSPLNMDYTLALGSSALTLYEMTKVFASYGRLGQRVRPLLIHKVVDQKDNVLLENVSLDKRFEKEIMEYEEKFEERRQNFLAWLKNNPEDGTEGHREGANDNSTSPTASSNEDQTKPLRDPSKEPPLFFSDENQLIKPQNAYVTTSLLQAAVDEPGGTGGAARALGRPAAAKTGTTNGYFDAWFIGYTPQIATGVWVGFDDEKTLGRGEVGGKAALPIWLEYMKFAHENLPVSAFTVPDGIVFSNIDNETGKLASASSKVVVRQAFIEGTEPTQTTDEAQQKEDRNFYKEDLSE